MTDKQFGRYVVDGELGRGGMSVVYRAHDPSLDRPVAVKVLHPHLADRADSRVRFAREARAIARLTHPNIVEVYDHAPAESERAFIVTEYIDGPTLRAFVDEHPIRFGEVAALVMIPVLDALQHAHRAGIVHRDVKPENIMLRSDGTPVLMDFGIAQMVDQDTLTATGTMLGSPAHMAPEIVEGEEITIMADLFSVGTVLYWLVCGALPFSGPNPAALFRRIAECRFDPVLHRRPQAGRAIARLIERCMAHNPQDRPPSAGAIADALRTLLAEGGLTDPKGELAQFLSDPEVYQDALGRRLVPAYVATAEAAYAEGQMARALDFLDRAMAIDEDEESARALLTRIERGQRTGRILRLAAVCAAAAVVASVVVWLIPESAVTPDGGVARAADAAVGSSAIAADTRVAPPSMSLPSSPMTTAPESAASATARSVASAAAPESAAPESAAPRTVTSKAPAPASVASRAPRSVRKRRPAAPKTAPATVASAAPETTAPPPMRTVRSHVASRLGGTAVWVNGSKIGYVPLIQAQDGLPLKTGGSYRVEFRNPGCMNDLHRFTVPEDANAGPRLVHKCRWRPAYIKVDSNRPDATVFGRNGVRLGQGGRRIPISMSGPSDTVTITVSSKDTQRDVKVDLFAGRTKSLTVNF